MKNFFYRVCVGDTLLSVCKNFNVSPTIIIKQNNLTREIEAGDILKIDADGVFYTVKPNDTIDSIAERFNVCADDILNENNIPYVFYGLVIKIP
jgi:spore germination protein YaaH